MDYMKEINAFERWLETHYLPTSPQLLWYKLMYICNRSGWSEWVTVDNLRLMAAMQMGREATLIKARDELIKAGLIEYQKGKKGSPNRYRIISLSAKNTFKSEVKSAVETVVKSEVESADIYKQKQKHKKKDTDVSEEKNLPSQMKRFVPPTVEEVRAYCCERGNNIDPERFVSWNESKGWMIGRNKMKDWKAAVRTWERNQQSASEPGKTKTQSNKFCNFEQRNTDYNQLLAEHYGYSQNTAVM